MRIFYNGGFQSFLLDLEDLEYASNLQNISLLRPRVETWIAEQQNKENLVPLYGMILNAIYELKDNHNLETIFVLLQLSNKKNLLYLYT